MPSTDKVSLAKFVPWTNQVQSTIKLSQKLWARNLQGAICFEPHVTREILITGQTHVFFADAIPGVSTV